MLANNSNFKLNSYNELVLFIVTKLRLSTLFRFEPVLYNGYVTYKLWKTFSYIDIIPRFLRYEQFPRLLGHDGIKAKQVLVLLRG